MNSCGPGNTVAGNLRGISESPEEVSHMSTYTYPAQATTYSTTTYPTQVTASPLVRWGAVFSGAVVALALTLLAGTLWVALAFGSHDAVFFNHLAWWFGGTAIAGMFIAALIAAG